MISKSIVADENKALSNEELYKGLNTILTQYCNLKKVLLIPPDSTRSQSGANTITEWYYLKLTAMGVEVNILPALGTHMAMTKEELIEFFGDKIPMDAYLTHNYKEDVVKIGEIPSEFINEVSEGLIDDGIDVEISRSLLDESYDLILSIGQVVPHEVAGMANYSKNIFVGVGGENMINATHILGAVYGMERVMGQDFSPVRKVFDYAETNFIQDLPIVYVLTVCTATYNEIYIHGLFIGRERKLFEQAVKLSQKLNLNYMKKAPKKVVVYLDEQEFKTTWVGNKAIYRTRMTIADGGELIILAPGVRRCGESPETDRLIRKYGYVGRLKILDLLNSNKDLQENKSIAAHLIHGSSDDRFNITYCPQHMTKDEVKQLGFDYLDFKIAMNKYPFDELKDGWNMLNGEEIFYVSNPAIGLWVDENRL